MSQGAESDSNRARIVRAARGVLADRGLDTTVDEVAEERRALVRSFTDAVWRSAGGDGRPPAWLADVCAVQLSAFTTRALTGDFGRSPDEIGRACARAVAAAVRAAIAEPARA